MSYMYSIKYRIQSKEQFLYFEEESFYYNIKGEIGNLKNGRNK